jgi:multiple sugar transport system substrate-binding protein
MKKVKIWALLMAVAMIFGMSACKPKDTAKNESTASVGDAASLKNDISISEGTDGMEKDLNFDKKEFKLAMPYTPGPDLQRKIDGFNKKFNANLKMSLINWSNFTTDLATATTSGSPYDVVFYHGNFYPMTIVANVLEPLQTAFTSADMFNSTKPDAGGFNDALTKFFTWNNSIYAVASNRTVFAEVLYYNKILFRDAGLDDPMTLYKNNKWTWDKLVEMGTEVTDPGNDTFFFGGMGNASVWMTLNCVSGITMSDNQYKQNLDDSKLISVMNNYKALFTGANAICSAELGRDEDRFNSGKQYMICLVTDAYSILADKAKNSNAFGKSVDNLGVVPVPFLSTNTDKAYPAHAPQGWAAGKGTKDIRVAVAFAKYESTWVDPSANTNAMPNEMKKIIDGLFNNKMYVGFAGFMDNDGNDYNQIMNRNIGNKISEGGDVASILSQNKQPMQKLIVDSMAKQE